MTSPKQFELLGWHLQACNINQTIDFKCYLNLMSHQLICISAQGAPQKNQQRVHLSSSQQQRNRSLRFRGWDCGCLKATWSVTRSFLLYVYGLWMIGLFSWCLKWIFWQNSNGQRCDLIWSMIDIRSPEGYHRCMKNIFMEVINPNEEDIYPISHTLQISRLPNLSNVPGGCRRWNPYDSQLWVGITKRCDS